MAYTSNLRIPCYNEWEQENEYRCPHSKQRVVSYESPIFRTLHLLRPYIDSGTRQQIIIHNDGSTDDTHDQIQRFKKEGKYGKELLIINHANNGWKIARFIEALKITLESGHDNMMMTDADMIYMPSLIIPRLTWETERDYEQGYGMVYSDQWEYKLHKWESSNRADHYESYDQETSWTRAVHVSKTYEALVEIAHGLGLKSIESLGNMYGYALEKLLKAAHFSRRNIMSVNTTEYDDRFNSPSSHTVEPENVPLFLKAMRKDSVQAISIKQTVAVRLNPYLNKKYNTKSIRL